MSLKKEPFDETAKAFYQRLFKSWGLKVETEREVFSRSRTIDLVVACINETDRERLQHTVFSHFRQLNAIELKGFHDPLTVDNLNRIIMRAWGLSVKKTPSTKKPASNLSDEKKIPLSLGDDEKIPLADEITVTMVCVTRPNKILNELKTRYRFMATQKAGIYLSDDVLSRWIICPSELDLIPENYPLLPLARGKKLEDFIALCVREGLNDYLQLILDVGLATDPEVIWRKILEVKQMKHQIREETWPIIDQFFQEMPEAIGKLPTFQEALAESQRQALQQGLQQGVQQGVQQGLQQGLQQGVQQGEHQGALYNEHRLLIRQLRQKFCEVPNSLVQQIESNSDIKQLDNWLDQIMLAKKLVEIDFNLSH